MSTLNVLLVSYSFPPAGGVGVLRAASLARSFPSEGIRLDVLTARNASAVGSDYKLLSEMPKEVNIHRTVTFDLPFVFKKGIKKIIGGAGSGDNQSTVNSKSDKSNIIKKALQGLMLPDPQVTWLPILTYAARRIIKQRSINVVIITVPPFSSLLLVEKLRKEFSGLAIVLDFRDEWLTTGIELFGFSCSERSRRIARNTEASAITNATSVVAVSGAARREIRARYPYEPDSKFHLIPNGFDAIRLGHSLPSTKRKIGDKIIVTHVGTLYNTTDPTKMVEALHLLPVEIKSRFTFRFVGHIEEVRFRDALLQLGEMVELKGYLPQSEALDLMNDTDYVLLISHDVLNIGAKFYDYIGGRKPILGVIRPDSEIRRLLEELRAGWWAGDDDVAGIQQLFVDAMIRGNLLSSEFIPDIENIEQYERKILARRYADLLHSIADNQHKHETQSSAADVIGAGI